MNQTICLLVMLLFIPEGEVLAATLASTALFQPPSTTTTSSQLETAPDQTAATASVTATFSNASTRTIITTEETAGSTHQPDSWSFSNDIWYYWEWAFSIGIWVGLTVFFVVLGIKKRIYICFCFPTCYRAPDHEIQ